tara:strand:- start:2016 stop:2192 length:177 start_codon:yes stop_codon:yes gene_type:complete
MTKMEIIVRMVAGDQLAFRSLKEKYKGYEGAIAEHYGPIADAIIKCCKEAVENYPEDE